MSVLIMGQVFNLELESTKKFVLLAYVDHADHDGKNIYPSVATIAKKTGYSERTIQRVTRELEKDGYLIPDGHGKQGTNKWRYGGGDTVSGVTTEVQGGDIGVTGGVTTTTRGGDKACHPNHHLTVIEPSITGNIGWIKICELYNLPVDVFETMLNGKQQASIKSLLEKDAEKCVKIAVYYNNMGDTFVRMVGRIINNFDTWKTGGKKEPRRKKERVV